MTELKLGKKAARRKATDLHFLDYRTSAEVKVPRTFGHETIVPNWGMLGNDRVGDCVWAGSDHEVMLWNKEAGVEVNFTDQNTLSDYSAVTGYNPNDPNSDQGTDVHQALDYRRATGTVDEAGKRHKIAAYVSITPGHWEHVLEATYLFSVVGIGFEVPSYAMQQFDEGKSWHLMRGKPSIEGGHYVPVVGRSHEGLLVVTWGRVQVMTKGFFERFCDEAYGILSPEMFKNGESLDGFDFEHLSADLNKLS